ncbi:hypothetical protein BUE80_DR007339 [Diplocarpon rosae]|nr:hypothetical protein BUE80_DR007339 [Diplocarpon rosae]
MIHPRPDHPTPVVPTTYAWDRVAYHDSAVASDLCDSTFSPPSSPADANFNPDIKAAEPACNFGTLDDWMRWDRPSDAALSPTSELFPDFMSEPMSPAMSGRELRGSGYGVRGSIVTGDGAVLGEDLVIDEPLFPTPTALAAPRPGEIAGQEGLYSTPLSWMRLVPSSPQPRRPQQQHNGQLSPEEDHKRNQVSTARRTTRARSPRTGATPPQEDGAQHDREALPDQPQRQDRHAARRDEPLFPTPTALAAPRPGEIAGQEGLYSTPLSWMRLVPSSPQPRRPQQQHNGQLSPEEEYQLCSIAMPPPTQVPGPGSGSPSSPPSSPDPGRSHKRKPSRDGEADDASPEPAHGRHPAPKKTAHNMIEKRYRTNLNDKIAMLRDAVPSLRAMSGKKAPGDAPEDLQGLTPAHKLNKATVLAKATEYIAHLEKQNGSLAQENASLRSRVDAFGILAMARQPPPHLGSDQQYIMDGFNTPM